MPVVGGYEGMMESQKHDAAMLLNMLSGAEKVGNIQMQPDRARLLAAEAGLKENELTQEQAFAQALSQAGGLGGPTVGQPPAEGGGETRISRAAPLYKAAQIAFSAGSVKKGTEFLTKASTIDHQDNLDRMEQQRLNYYQAKTNLEDLQRLSGFYGTVKSQEDLDRANEAYQQVYPNQPLPAFARLPYDPTRLAGFLASQQTQQERIQAKLRERDQTLREEEIEARRRREKATDEAKARRDELQRQRDERKAKEAGKPKPSELEVKDGEIEAARRIIKDTIFQGDVPPEFADTVRNGALAIAARAKALLRGNDGLDKHAAYMQAVEESLKENEWPEAELPAKSGWGSLVGNKVKGKRFQPKTARGGAAADIWAAPKAVPLDRKFEEGVVYNTPRGPLLRKGGKWYAKGEADAAQ